MTVNLPKVDFGADASAAQIASYLCDLVDALENTLIRAKENSDE